ncbi:flagellar filament capping protein FliD [Actinoplanes aureus]|uniref:Flagellar hook-associated protein 2 n=1 Tax=Actinoplanes aureus TaxID=2792083 RepID=A0A931G652_9ACTN|nr:flagellar filament capping protein FliD [Actinoplanes aureus]MBG0566894.1 flagellar filament capping protein FliD [Actinoplanes aureus]
MSSSVDGLVSGLSTSSLISSLMQVEAAPQNRLKTKLMTAETTVASYQSVNSKLSALKGSADTLGQLSTWRALKATSSSDTVTATATGGTTAAAGTTTFDVVKVANAQVSTLKYPAGTTDATGNNGSSVTFTFGVGDPVTVDLGTSKKPSDIAAAINSTKGLNVRAGVVTTSTGDTILQLSSTKPGTDNAFAVIGLSNGVDVAPTDVTAAENALIRVGSLNVPADPTSGLTPGSYEVESSSNTFTGLMAGVSVTVTKPAERVTVSAQADTGGIAEKLQAFVDAANAVLTEVSTQTSYDPTTKKGSPLTGDFMVRELSQKIMGSISGGLSYANPKFDDTQLPDDLSNPEKISFGSLAQIGIQLDRSGKLTFDPSKFTSAYNGDPTKIQEAMIGLADNFEEQTSKQSLTVANVITGRRLEIDNFNTQISNWDTRLAARKISLQKQYTNLETSLGNLKNQSNWLAGQLGSLG